MNLFDTLNLLEEMDDGNVLLEDGVYQYVVTGIEVKPSKSGNDNLVAHITGDLMWEKDNGEYVPLPHKHWLVINGGLSNEARFAQFLYELDIDVEDNNRTGVYKVMEGASILSYVYSKQQTFTNDDGEVVEYTANQIKYFLNSRPLEEVSTDTPLTITSVFEKPSARNKENTVYTFWLVGESESGRKVNVTHTVTVSKDPTAKSNKAAKVFFAMIQNDAGQSALELRLENVKDLVGMFIDEPNVTIKEVPMANNQGQNSQRYALELDWNVLK